MNQLLDEYRLAAGAHVFVSEGMLVVPYEDGKPKTPTQKIIDIKEQKNAIFEQMDIITHSQKVLVKLHTDATTRLNEAEANLAEASAKKGKDKYDSKKECEELVKEARQAVRDIESQQRKNNHEIERMVLNVQLFDEAIKELGG